MGTLRAWANHPFDKDAAQHLTYRYVIHAYEDARQKHPMKHEHGGTTVLTDGAEALRRAEEIAREFPDGWVFIHLEYRGARE